MTTKLSVNADTLRDEVQSKYAEVATDPSQRTHFHTGRHLAGILGYPQDIVNRLPDQAVESFAGVGNPFSVGTIEPGDRVVDVGSGAGFDSIIASQYVGDEGRVVGVDMTREMLDKADGTRRAMGLENVEFRFGFAEQLPVEDGWADAVISNGVVNLSLNKKRVLGEIFRVLKPGGSLMLADIITGKPVPQSARGDVDLWTN